MSLKTTSASLRIFTPEDRLDFVSSTLQMIPTTQHLKGQLRSARNPKSSWFEESVWIYQSPLSDVYELHEHIEKLVEVLESKTLAIQSIIHGLSLVDIFCLL